MHENVVKLRGKDYQKVVFKRNYAQKTCEL